MAIDIYDGRPGDGKSYCAVANRILPHLARGGFVATNIAMRPDGVSAWIKARTGRVFNRERLLILEEEQVPRFNQFIPKGSMEMNVLVVLDEVHRWFNARDWAKSDQAFREVFMFATKHRHYFIDMVLISQHVQNIDGQLTRNMQSLVRFRDLKRWHPPGAPWFRIPFFRFLAAYYDRDGKTLQRREMLVFDKLVGAAYDTHSLGNTAGGTGAGQTGREPLAQDPAATARIRAVQKWIIRLGWFVLAVAIVLLIRWRMAVAREEDQEALRLLTVKMEKLAASPKLKVVAGSSPSSEPAVPVVPSKWLDAPPVHEVWITTAAYKNYGIWRLRVPMDGAVQDLTPGIYTTRGRCMTVQNVSPTLWTATMLDDDGKRRFIRVLRSTVGVAGLPARDSDKYLGTGASSGVAVDKVFDIGQGAFEKGGVSGVQ